MGLYFPVNPPMKQDILPHKNVCPMAFYPLNYENRYHPCFQLWIHSRSAAAPKANSQSTRLSDTQNQQGFVGTPLIMHSSVLTTGKGFIRTCWIFCLFCLNLFIFNGRIIKKKQQYCVGFSIHQHGSATGIHMLPPSRLLQSPGLSSLSHSASSLSHSANSHWLSIFHMVICFHATLSTLSFPPNLTSSPLPTSISLEQVELYPAPQIVG